MKERKKGQASAQPTTADGFPTIKRAANEHGGLRDNARQRSLLLETTQCIRERPKKSKKEASVLPSLAVLFSSSCYFVFSLRFLFTLFLFASLDENSPFAPTSDQKK